MDGFNGNCFHNAAIAAGTGRGLEMREEELLSVGIDIGTSTTQCVFSLLTMKNTASAFSVPRISLTGKKILYRSENQLTPLLDPVTIDAAGVEKMIRSAFEKASISPREIKLGAVIITGETARKQNAREVATALSELAGDFVVATAGPSLESVLAGRGSGAAALSDERGRSVLNLDIGGGTTNMALFEHGKSLQDGCLNIGGRLLRFETDDKTVLSFSPFLEKIADGVGISLKEGQILSLEDKVRIADRMAELLEEAANLRERSPLYQDLILEHGLQENVHPELFTFSGGVADCVYGLDSDAVPFHDLGKLLGKAIAKSRFFTSGRVILPKETEHATVIGAGAYSVTVSGSTIQYSGMNFPIKSLPAAAVPFSKPEDIPHLRENIISQYRAFEGECALCMEGMNDLSWEQFEQATLQIAEGMKDATPKIIIMKEDMAKALGQALSRLWPEGTPFLCLDGIELNYGDTVDIGSPLGGGRAVPVIVKTFVFSQTTGRNL